MSVAISGTTGCTGADATYTADWEYDCYWFTSGTISAGTTYTVEVRVVWQSSTSIRIIVIFAVVHGSDYKSTTWQWDKVVSSNPMPCGDEYTGFTEVGVTYGAGGQTCDGTFPTMVLN